MCLHSPPDEIDQLRPYPHIFKFVVENWGTVSLKEYFDKLILDNRDGNRKGFPTKVSIALLTLSLANIEKLENNGLTFESLDTGFSITPWKLPKNF